jgi:hypothetical protein
MILKTTQPQFIPAIFVNENIYIQSNRSVMSIMQTLQASAMRTLKIKRALEPSMEGLMEILLETSTALGSLLDPSEGISMDSLLEAWLELSVFQHKGSQ